MNIQATQRLFIIDGRELPDPAPNGSLEDVRKILATNHPAVTNAEFGSAAQDGAWLRYTLKTKIGVKG